MTAAPGAARPELRGYGKVPLFFEANLGQAASSVCYLSRGAGHVLSLTDSKAELTYNNAGATSSVGIRWLGGAVVKPEAEERQSGVSNYLLGSDPAKWNTGVPHFAKIRYRGVYPGVDVLFYGRENRLEYDMVVAPGADPSRIRFQFEGAGRVSLQKNGDLLIGTRDNDLRQLRPVAYQDTGSGRRYVTASYEVSSRNEVRFKIGRYDSSLPLIIDPVITWAAYLGGTSADLAAAVAVDAAGNAYITGHSFSTTFFTAGAYDTTHNGNADAYVAKVNSAGTAFVYVTYFGGGGSDAGQGIAVDAQGNVVITGDTTSPEGSFPLINSIDGIYGGAVDGFVAKLNAAGNGLIFSTYLGGSAQDRGLSVAVDGTGSIYTTGFTLSSNFTGAAASGYGGLTDAFVVKLAPTGGLIYSVYQGGNSHDYGASIVADAAGNAHVAGYTSSANLTGQGFQPSLRGAQDGFIMKLNGTGVRQYWAYFGGSNLDIINALALDSNGNIYVTGDTQSDDLPLVRAIQSNRAGDIDAFVAKLNPDASAIVYSTYIGGNLADRTTGIAVDSGGSAAVSGYTFSPTFPRINSINASLRGPSDAFALKLTPSGNARYYSALLGGNGDDRAFAIAMDTTGREYVVGDSTASGIAVTLPGNTFGGGDRDGFALRLGGCSVALTPLESGFTAAGGRRAIQVQTSPDCNWAATTGSGFVTLATPTSGSGNGFVVYDVAPNPGVARSGSITIAGQQIPLSQQGSIAAGCSYTVSQPSLPNIAATGGSGSITIAAAANCSWSVYTNARWAQVFPIAGVGNATINYTIFPNFSTAQRQATITVAGQARSVTQSAGAGTRNQRLVQLIYFSFLGRLPSQADRDFQASQLDGGTPPGQLIMNFYNSEEFNQGSRFIAGIYVGLLDRDAEYGGWLFQRTALTGGVTQDSLVSNFLASAEYSLRFRSPGDAEFVRLLYRHILGREATQQEVNLQVSSLNNGTFTRVSLARFFLNSEEFRNATGPRLTAFLLYATLLQRDPSPAEFAARINELASSQKTVRQIVDELIATGEFNANLN